MQFILILLEFFILIQNRGKKHFHIVGYKICLISHNRKYIQGDGGAAKLCCRSLILLFHGCSRSRSIQTLILLNAHPESNIWDFLVFVCLFSFWAKNTFFVQCMVGRKHPNSPLGRLDKCRFLKCLKLKTQFPTPTFLLFLIHFSSSPCDY